MKDKKLADMILLATQAHHGQFDKGGTPYILHPIAVCHLMKTQDSELKQIAIGHDLIEDTFVTPDELTNRGFSYRVISGIIAMSKVPGQAFSDYKTQVMNNLDAAYVKIHDLTHNSDIKRIKGVTQKDFDRVARYHNFYLELKAHLEKYEYTELL